MLLISTLPFADCQSIAESRDTDKDPSLLINVMAFKIFVICDPSGIFVQRWLYSEILHCFRPSITELWVLHHINKMTLPPLNSACNCRSQRGKNACHDRCNREVVCPPFLWYLGAGVSNVPYKMRFTSWKCVVSIIPWHYHKWKGSMFDKLLFTSQNRFRTDQSAHGTVPASLLHALNLLS